MNETADNQNLELQTYNSLYYRLQCLQMVNLELECRDRHVSMVPCGSLWFPGKGTPIIQL